MWYSIEPPRRGGSNEYPQSMFSSKNTKNSVYPCKPQFYYIKVGFKEVKIIRHVFVMETSIVDKVIFFSTLRISMVKRVKCPNIYGSVW